MKPPWQVVNLLESPAANGKQSLVDPVPIQTPYLLMGREGEEKELPQKAERQLLTPPYFLSVSIISIPSTSIHRLPWAKH